MPISDYKITTLTMDFKSAVYDALNYLTELGHTKIAYLGGKEYVGNHELFIDERKQSFISYMANHGLDTSWIYEDAFSTTSGYQMALDLLTKEPYPTAIFAANDAIAFGAMKAIREKGLSIPEDISITGFDDLEFAEHIKPSLTTIRQDFSKMGKTAFELLSALFINKTPQRVTLKGEIVERNSVVDR